MPRESIQPPITPEYPSHVISPESASSKQVKWKKEGYNEKEIQELTNVLNRVGEINDWFQEQVIRGDEYWLDPKNSKEREEMEQTKASLFEEKESIKSRLSDMKQALADRKQAEADEARQRELQERIAKGELIPLQEQIMEKAEGLQDNLNSRVQELDPKSNLQFNITPPEVPENFTTAHFDAIKAIFGENLEPTILPTPEELYKITTQELDEYRRLRIREVEATKDPNKHKPLSAQEQTQLKTLTAKLELCADTLYPKPNKDRQAEDKTKHNGLVSYRPDWFDKTSDINITGSTETWGQAYLRSMHEELQKLGDSMVFIETIQKPNYNKGKQHYGTKEGDDAKKDPLLHLFKQAFEPNANRFNHSWDDIQTKLIPKVKEYIIQQFENQKPPLSVPDFEVILTPASLSNLQITLSHPENSQTNTLEWTSTRLSNIQGEDTGHRLHVGGSGLGGAADVNDGPCSRGDDNGGVRLAVVIKK